MASRCGIGTVQEQREDLFEEIKAICLEIILIQETSGVFSEQKNRRRYDEGLYLEPLCRTGRHQGLP